MCNWPSWTDAKPERLDSDIEICGEDIILQEESGECWVAEYFWWSSFKTLKEAEEHMMKSSGFRAWPLLRKRKKGDEK